MTSAGNTEALTVTELAERWGTGRNTVLDAIKAGKLAAFKIGVKKLRVTVAEIERFEREGGTTKKAAAS